MLRSIEQYITQEEQRKISDIIGSLYGEPIEQGMFDFIGLGQNYVAFRFRTKKNQLCIKFLISDKVDKLQNLEYALSICETHNIPTNRFIYKDDTCEDIHLPFLITTFLEGTIFEFEQYSDIEKQTYLSELGSYLARIHNIQNNYFCTNITSKKTLELKSYVSERFLILYEAMISECNIEQTIQSDIKHIFKQLYYEIEFNTIYPSLVHRDISATNIIVLNKHLQGLIDFEHACYFDYVWDFVKLQLNILSQADPISEKCFWSAYTKMRPLGDEICVRRRYKIYYLLELMWAVVNDYQYERARYKNLLVKFIHEFK